MLCNYPNNVQGEYKETEQFDNLSRNVQILVGFTGHGGTHL